MAEKEGLEKWHKDELISDNVVIAQRAKAHAEVAVVAGAKNTRL
jgi:hypothetical protein